MTQSIFVLMEFLVCQAVVQNYNSVGIVQTDDFWVNASIVLDYNTMGVVFDRIIIGFDVAASNITTDDILYSTWVVQEGYN